MDKCRLVQESLPEKLVLKKSSYDDKWNEDIVETAGFIPLEVRFKQMEQAGFRAQFFESEFDSRDVTDMYLSHPEFDINPEDEIEEMIQKMELRAKYIQSVKNEVRARAKREAEANDSAAKESVKKTVSESKDEQK